MSRKEKPHVAYFCMEYGLSSDLRIYSGGLGILAGDILKTARENNYPFTGIGILWRQGYTRQLTDREGRPYDCYPCNDYIYDYLEDTGITVRVKIREGDLLLKIWKLDKFGNSPLFLLDANIEKNGMNKWLTAQLYGGFEEERIAQEIILGIGGIRALRKLGIDIDIYHFNEGHAVLAATELIKEKMSKGKGFKKAWSETRKEVIFTTHTPIKEGNETHSLKIMEYMGAFNGLTLDQMVQIGNAPFNMTVAGLRLSRIANGVSQLHGNTARKMWSNYDNTSEIMAITNGIHKNTWVDSRITAAYQKTLNSEENEEDIWATHQQLKQELLDYVQQRTGQILQKDSLLIGFARRAAPYKRSDFIFREEKKIAPYLAEGKLQIIFAGKAHPLDDTGKKIVNNLVKKTKEYPESVVFLENYDMETGKMMTRGVDVWLNNPRRPLEASGTSGMKAAMNGVLNLSILDGWWTEACEHGRNGWQFGNGYQGKGQDKHDLKFLYKVLFEEVIPAYYNNHRQWVNMMKKSIETTSGKYAASNMLNEYYNKLY